LLCPNQLGCAIVYVDVLCEAEGEEFPHEGAGAAALQLGQEDDCLEPFAANPEVDLDASIAL
jgi:hypothetical protein